MFIILTRGDTPLGNADMAKLADAHDSGSCGKPCRFKSCYPHQTKHLPERVGVYLVRKDKQDLAVI